MSVRVTWLRGAGALSARVVLISYAVTGAGAPAPAPGAAVAVAPAGSDHLCGWLYGFAGDPARAEQAYETFAAHAAEIDAVHPVWWRVESPTSIVNHPASRPAPIPASTTPACSRAPPRAAAGPSSCP